MEGLTERLQQYKDLHGVSYNYLYRATEILKIFIDRSYEAYIVGDAVRNYFLYKKIDSIEIVTSATTEEIHAIFPALVIDKNKKVFIKDSSGLFFFSTFKDDTETIAGKYAEKYYNKKLTKCLQERIFTCNALALSPNFNLTDIFNGKEDIDNRLIRTINKPKLLFKESPESILEALVLVSQYGLEFEPKTLKGAIKCSCFLEDLNEVYVITTLRKIIAGRYAYDALEIIKKYRLFKYIPQFEVYIKKIYNNFDMITKREMIAILYLIVGEIKDSSCFLEEELAEIKELMSNARLILTDDITPVMVYYIGKDNLLSADRVACVFKSSYKSQYKHIIKLDKKCIINDLRDFDLTDLELASLLPNEKPMIVHAIKNILLEKVINREIQNHNALLKKEALVLADELREIFNYQDPSNPIIYDEYEIKDVLAKYKKEYSLLLKVYLSHEEELYSLTSLERLEFIKKSEDHAREFLLETNQYKILEERGLI